MAYPGPFPIKVEQGGTGDTAVTANAVVIGDTADQLTSTNVGTNGQLLIGKTSGTPAFASLTSTGGTITYTAGANSLNLETAGSVPIVFHTGSGNATPSAGAITMAGGNNISTSGSGSTVTYSVSGTTNHALQIGNSTGSLTSLGVATNGQIPIGSTGANPVLANISAGSGITVTNGSGSIQIASTVVGGIQTIAGDQGAGATGTTVTIKTGYMSGPLSNGTAQFIANGSTSSFQFNDGFNNVCLGPNAAAGGGGPGGSNNTGLGASAMGSSGGLSGDGNTGIGFSALERVTSGANNTGVGFEAGFLQTTGQYNCFMGYTAGGSIGPTTGSYNIEIGYQAGHSYQTSESSNISLNASSTTTTGESNVLRIGNGTGTGNQQLAKAFISGISGVNVGSVASVVSISGDQLGSTTLTAGSNIAITAGSNTITIASTGGGSSFTWNTVSGTSQAMAVNNGYIANNAGLVTLTLPATAAVGDMIRVTGKGAGGWTIAQNSGQTIYFGTSTTTTGVGGSLASSQQRDGVEIVCVTANNDFNVLSAQGNLTVV